jgi:hypothetical protein
MVFDSELTIYANPLPESASVSSCLGVACPGARWRVGGGAAVAAAIVWALPFPPPFQHLGPRAAARLIARAAADVVTIVSQWNRAR